MTASPESAASAEDPGVVVGAASNGRPRSTSASRLSGAMPRALILLIGAAAAVVVVAGIRQVAWLVGPVFLALIIVIAAHPVQRWLRDRGWPSWVATLALVLVVYVGLLALFVVLFVSVGQLATVLPQYSAQFDALLASVQQSLAGFGIGQTQIQAATHSASLSSVVGAVGGILSGVGGILTVVVLILALLLFFIADASSFDKRLASIESERPHIVRALESFANGTRSYLVVTTVFGFIVAVLDGIALEIMGIPLAILWAVLAFITNYIPNIGFIFGLVPPALLGLLTGGWQLLIAVVVVYCVLNLVIQSLIQPRFIGNSVGLSATVTFVTLLFWAWVLGPLGALLAIPLTLLAKALLVDVDPRARWADALLRTDAEEPQEEQETGEQETEEPDRTPDPGLGTDEDSRPPRRGVMTVGPAAPGTTVSETREAPRDPRRPGALRRRPVGLRDGPGDDRARGRHDARDAELPRCDRHRPRCDGRDVPGPRVRRLAVRVRPRRRRRRRTAGAFARSPAPPGSTWSSCYWPWCPSRSSRSACWACGSPRRPSGSS